MTDMAPTDVVVTLAEAYVGSRCLHVAADLGVADAIGDDLLTIDEVNRRVQVDPGALERVIRHLVTLGIFEFEGDRVRNNAPSHLLRGDDPSGMLPLTRLLGLSICWDSVGALGSAVRTGRPGATFVDPDGLFAYLDAHPEESRVYDQGMTAMTERRISRIVPAYDFSAYRVIADIGGGNGHLLRAVLDQTPGATGILFDRAQVVSDIGAHDRISVQPGDFFAGPMPAADAYLLSNIIHDWSDAEAIEILRRVRGAAAPRARLLLFEFPIPDDRGSFVATDIDVEMLALVSGRERRLTEYDDLLTRSGWRLVGTVPTESQTIIEADAI